MRALGLLLLFCVRSHAQVPPIPGRFAAGSASWAFLIGPSYPAGAHGLSRAVGSGPQLAAQYLRFVSDWAALGAEASFTYLGLKGIDSTDPAAQAKGLARMSVVEALARVNLRESSAVSPYAVAGIGYHGSKISVADGSAAYDPHSALGLPRGLRNGLALSAGAGVEGFLFDGFSLGLEARWRQARAGTKADKAAEWFGFLFVVRFWPD